MRVGRDGNGRRLYVGVTKSAAARRRLWYNMRRFLMCMQDEIRAKRDEIYAIARKHRAEKLWVFGSCARREERANNCFAILFFRGENNG